MDKIRFTGDTINIYDADVRYVSNHVVSIQMNVYPDNSVLLSGFEVLNASNLKVMGDFTAYTTRYRLLPNGTVQLSNDGSTYVDPTPVVVYKDIPTEIIWNDDNNVDGFRPSSVTVKLLMDGKEEASAVLSSDNEWSHTFEHLDASHTYNVTARTIPHYTGEISGYTIIETHETLASVKAAKISEMNHACTAQIEAGTDIELSVGIEHFNFSSYVQTNIATAYNAAVALVSAGHPEETIPFYNSNNECQLFSANDIMIIYFTMGVFETYAITLAHQLADQINNMTSASEIKAITFDVGCLDTEHAAQFAEIVAKSEEIVQILKNRTGEEETEVTE